MCNKPTSHKLRTTIGSIQIFQVSKACMCFFFVVVHSSLQGGKTDHLVKGRVFLVIQ